MSFYADVLSSFDESLEKYPDNQFMVIDILINHLYNTDYNEIENVINHLMNKIPDDVKEQIKNDSFMKLFIEDCNE